LPGKKKLSYESCLVRGYWGDIVMSPYLAFGIESDYEPKLFKIANRQQCGHSVETSEFNLEYYLTMLAEQKKYKMVFTDAYRKEGREEEIRK